MCQRYYYNIDTSNKPFTWVTYTSNGDTRGRVLHPVTMRASPTMSASNTAWNSVGFGRVNDLVNVITNISFVNPNVFGWSIGTDTAYTSYGTVVVWGSSTGVIIYANAEL